MKIAIVDDEELYLKQLTNIVSKYCISAAYDVDIMTYHNGKDFLSYYNTGGRFNIIFMDIEVNDMNGIEIVADVRQIDNNAIVIFVTNYDCYVSTALRVGALQFLKKPIKEEDVNIDLARAMEKYLATRSKYEFKFNSNIKVLEFNEILFFEVYYKKIKVHSCQGVFVEDQRGSIENKAKALSKFFFIRCHSSYMVNLSKISSIDITNIALINGDTVPLSRNYRKSLMEAYNKYLAGYKI